MKFLSCLRTLVFIVSYQAERHIASVFDRVPQVVWDDLDIDFLVIDDASADNSVGRAADWAKDRYPGRVTVLRNPINQGYGGNQKLGYRLAIERGYDFVILLHGDGQYAPELLPKFIEIYKATNAGVVLGTRMDTVKSARAGGMPWYKVVGNRLLTTFQNRLTGQTLAEWHTGYRGYSKRYLESVPFEANSNAFHFDTEILLQAVHVRAKIEQFPIPTHYGDETCHVNGPRYAGDVIAATLQFRMHQMGMMCSLKYRDADMADDRARTRPIYEAEAHAIDVLRRRRPRRVLAFGDLSQPVASAVESFDGQTTVVPAADFERPRPDAFDYDAVLLLDVLENTAEPERFLVSLRHESRVEAAVRKPPMVLITTPNVAFIGVRLCLLFGRFNYAERGILDIRHKRLFTRRSLYMALDESGYGVERITPIGVPFAAVLHGSRGRLLGTVARWLAAAWPGAFAFQWLVVAHPRPGVRQLLAQSERHLVSHGMPVASGAADKSN